MIILKQEVKLTYIEEIEKELTVKIGQKVIILPYGLTVERN